MPSYELTRCQQEAFDGACRNRMYLITGPAGTGKAQPMDAKILGPEGWMNMGDVRIGSKVVGVDGLPHRVDGVYPQGRKPIFRVTMTDGAVTECCADHLWLTRSQRDRDEFRTGQVQTLRDISGALKEPSGKHLHWIPLVPPVEFSTRDLPLDPYALGLLLGDGCLRRSPCSFSNPESELVQALASLLPPGTHLKRSTSNPIDYRIIGQGRGRSHPLQDILKALEMFGKGSTEKFIPDQYKFTKSGHRVALLQGLLDTDGSVSGSTLEYSTSSVRLAEDVLFMVRSLGGTSSWGVRQPTYTYRGERRQGHTSYRLHICLPGFVWPFRLMRKACSHTPRTKYVPRRAIEKIEPAGVKEVQCISVDAPEQLYVTDDFIVTHNTFAINKVVEDARSRGLTVRLAAPTGKAAKRLEQVTGRRAQTIHRLLGYNGEEWRHNAENPIDADVVLTDEVSMADTALMYHLLSAIDFTCTRLILAGDHNQLPPVGPGNVLRDILTHNLIPYTVLDEVVRQAGPLRRNSLEVLNGRAVGLRKSDPVTSDWKVVSRYDDAEDALNFLLRLYQRVFAERLGYDILRDMEVLAPQRKGAVGVENLNLALQAVIQQKLFGRRIPPVKPNRRPPLYPGDKVIQTKNDYSIDVMNGHIGYVVEADPKEKRWVVDFEDRGPVELDEDKIQRVMLAFATTIHRFQGSEVPCAVCILHSSHSFMLHRNLAYTAVTRARDRAVIIGDRKGIQRAVRIQKVDDRRTILDVTRGAVP